MENPLSALCIRVGSEGCSILQLLSTIGAKGITIRVSPGIIVDEFEATVPVAEVSFTLLNDNMYDVCVWPRGMGTAQDKLNLYDGIAEDLWIIRSYNPVLPELCVLYTSYSYNGTWVSLHSGEYTYSQTTRLVYPNKTCYK